MKAHLKWNLDKHPKIVADVSTYEYHAAEFADALLRASRDAKDAARYRWLREGAQVTWSHGDGIALVVPTRGGLETVDADIDAAMSEASA